MSSRWAATVLASPTRSTSPGSSTGWRWAVRGEKRPLLLGLRWTVERTNSWLSNHGQLQRNIDRCSVHRLAQLALAIVLIITAEVIDWHDRWNRP